MVCLPISPLPHAGDARLQVSIAEALKPRSCATSKLLPLYDGSKGGWIEAGSANQSAINFLLRHQCMSVFRFNASSVDDSQLPGCICADCLRGFASNKDMSICGNLRCRGLACANGPNRFIGNAEAIHVCARDLPQSCANLTTQDAHSQSGLALLKQLANANNRFQSVRQRAAELAIDTDVCLSKVLPTLGVADDYLCTAHA